MTNPLLGSFRQPNTAFLAAIGLQVCASTRPRRDPYEPQCIAAAWASWLQNGVISDPTSSRVLPARYTSIPYQFLSRSSLQRSAMCWRRSADAIDVESEPLARSTSCSLTIPATKSCSSRTSRTISTKIAIRVTVMNEVQFLLASEPRKPLKPRPFYVYSLSKKTCA